MEVLIYDTIVAGGGIAGQSSANILPLQKKNAF
jgi:hypothetical protein